MTDPIQIESPQAQINRARFAGKDFFTFVDDIIARIQSLFVTEFNDFVSSGTGQMLIDIVAWAGETLSFYIDRQATESYLATARTRKAVNRLARQVGYKMAPSVSASVDLEVTLGAVFGFDVTIPEGFQFQGPGGLIFEATEAVTFLAGEGPTTTPRVVAVREGETIVETFVSNGAKNQIFRLNPGTGKTVAGAGFDARVDGVPWVESEIITFDSTDQFEVGHNDEPPTLRFGDGVAGNIPPSGVEVRAEYVANSGVSGLVTSNSITSVVTPLVVFATIIPLTITNPEPSSGGADRETLESAKINAPRIFKARDVAVTQEDYESLSQAFADPLAGAVAVAQAFVARSADDDIQLQILLNNIRGIAEPLEANVNVETAGIRSDLDDELDPLVLGSFDGLNKLRDDAETSANTVGARAVDIETAAATGKASLQELKNKTGQISVDAADIQNLVVDGKAAVDASGAPPGDKTTINGFFDLIDVEASAIDTNSSGAEADASAGVTEFSNIESAEEELTTANDDVEAKLTAMTPFLVDIGSRVDNIDALVGSDFVAAIGTELDAIFDHVDGFLAADCKANLVQVPILTRDLNGFLAAPSIALIRSLQAFLEERNEVTHTLEVVSGESSLVPAVIEATIGILPGFVRQTVLSNVNKAVDDLLRIRAFGASLRTSDLDTVTAPNPTTGLGGIPGVKYSVYRILGSLDSGGSLSGSFLDVDGNLIIDQGLVITKGTVTLTAEEAAA